MAYYHILKERRTNLKLSIQDVSNQTRLAPQYIQAIEEHNLDVFSDDFSFVRYFVHAYCDAIGVNWNAISQEVDEDVNAFARERDMALSMAQKRLVQQMSSVQTKPSVTKKKKRKKSKNLFQKHISKTSSSLSTNQKKLVKVLVLIGVIGLGVLSAINFGLRSASNKNLEAQQQARQKELDKKEEETNKLAKQRKKEKEASSLKITAMDGQENTYQISNIQSDVKSLDLSITIPTKTKISVTKDDAVVNDDSKLYTSTFTQSLELSDDCTFTISIDTYSDNDITINGKTIKFDKTNWQEGQAAVITLQVGNGYQVSESDDSSLSDGTYDGSDYYYSDDYYNQGEVGAYDENEYSQQTYYN